MIETNLVLQALREQGIDSDYINLLKEVYNECTTEVTFFGNPVIIPVRRGVRQNEAISPKLFTAALESVMRSLRWDEKSIKLNGEYLSHLRFADSVALILESVEEAQNTLQQLEAESRKIGLTTDMTKTK